jgi:hypothetical protein
MHHHFKTNRPQQASRSNVHASQSLQPTNQTSRPSHSSQVIGDAPTNTRRGISLLSLQPHSKTNKSL